MFLLLNVVCGGICSFCTYLYYINVTYSNTCHKSGVYINVHVFISQIITIFYISIIYGILDYIHNMYVVLSRFPVCGDMKSSSNFAWLSLVSVCLDDYCSN